MDFNDTSLSSAVIDYLRHFLLCVLVEIIKTNLWKCCSEQFWKQQCITKELLYNRWRIKWRDKCNWLHDNLFGIKDIIADIPAGSVRITKVTHVIVQIVLCIDLKKTKEYSILRIQMQFKKQAVVFCIPIYMFALQTKDCWFDSPLRQYFQ